MPCEQYFLNWFIMEKYVFKLLPCAGGDIVPLSHKSGKYFFCSFTFFIHVFKSFRSLKMLGSFAINCVLQFFLCRKASNLLWFNSSE